MRTNKWRRQCASLLISLAVLLALGMPLFSVSARMGDANNTVAPIVRVAPPAPVFDEGARLSELASRRARVADQIGQKSILVLFSGEPRVYTNDVDYKFRMENNLYYLTSLKQQGATLVLMPGNPNLREILFLPRRNPAAETWTGHMYSPQEARSISGITEIWEAKEFKPFMDSLRTRRAYRPKPESLLMSAATQTGTAQPVTPPVPMSDQTTAAANAATPVRPVTADTPANLTMNNAPSRASSASAASPSPATTSASVAPAQNSPGGFEALFGAMTKGEASLYLLRPSSEETREYQQERKFAEQWGGISTGFVVRDAWPIFTEMRMRKSPAEIELLQHAIDISIEGHERAQAVAARTKMEYEVEAEVDYTYKRRNADNWGYPNIVGCGPNATTLHYEESQGPVRQGDLLLMDAGAEYGHYSADVTRTFPINGHFSPAQTDIYNAVYDAQEAAFRAIHIGGTLTEVHNAALEVIKDRLLKLGLITDRNSDQYRIWFMHGTSHWLGMNVHDVGTRGAKLDTGMVFTVEPGIYVRLDALDYLPDTPENRKFIEAVKPAFEKYKGIGVRIEDDVVVTPNGYLNMSGALPRTISDIEAFMARASREVRTEE